MHIGQEAVALVRYVFAFLIAIAIVIAGIVAIVVLYEEEAPAAALCRQAGNCNAQFRFCTLATPGNR